MVAMVGGGVGGKLTMQAAEKSITILLSNACRLLVTNFRIKFIEFYSLHFVIYDKMLTGLQSLISVI